MCKCVKYFDNSYLLFGKRKISTCNNILLLLLFSFVSFRKKSGKFFSKKSKSKKKGRLSKTYVERFDQDDPAGFGQDGKVFQVLGIVGRQIVDDGAIVVGILVRGRDA